TLNTEMNDVSHQQLFLHEDKILENNLPQAQGDDLFSSSATMYSSVPLSYPLVVINSDTSVPYITPSKSSMPLTPKARSVTSSEERSDSPTIELSHDEFMSPPSPLSSKDPQDGEYYDTRKKDKINRNRRSRNAETKSHALRSQSVRFQGSSNKQSRQREHQSDLTRMKKNGMSLVCRKCNTTFTDSKRLREHCKTHVGERPFVCKIKGCDKTYTRESQLKAHVKTHST
ncbi:10814_t:CDS:1, partial [Cetraspora pellucida]